MSKRFTDTQIWEKEWFMKLNPKQKCLWRYITERCDQSGVWETNWHLASIYIGEPVSKMDTDALGTHIEYLENGKIFVPDFIDFQYGRISESSPAHKPIFRAITKNNLSNRVFNRVSNTLKEKEIDKEEEKEVEEVKESPKKIISKQDISLAIFSDEIFVNKLESAHNGKDIKQAWYECFIHHSNSKNPPREIWEWKQKLNTWLTIKPKEKKNGTHKNTPSAAIIDPKRKFTPGF